MRSSWLRRVLLTVAMGTSMVLAAPGGALAQSVEADDQRPVGELTSVEHESDRTVIANVYSPSMDKVIPLRIRTPADSSEPRPTLYLINGSGGGQGIATWEKQTDVEDFFSDKNINVVTPLLGGYSYYTDWRNDDPALGRNMWTTFLTHELPPVIDTEFGTSGRNAIAGVSMSGTSVLGLATTAPELYEAVGAYSGCAETSTPLGQSYVQAVVRVKGGDPENMWGPVGDPAWIENDPYLQAEKLRGIDLYISSGSGLPGQYERLGSRSVNNDPIGLVGQVVVGGSIEAAVNHCTQRMAQRLEELDIPARIDLRPAGTHSWDYWEDDLRNSWPLLSQAVGL